MATVKYFQTNDTNDKNNISFRNVIFSVICTYFFLIFCMLVLSVSVVYGPLGTATAEKLVGFIYCISCFVCGFLSSVNEKKRGWLNGFITSIAFYLTVVLSVVAVSEARICATMLVRFALTLFLGVAGGIAGVNTKRKKKR